MFLGQDVTFNVDGGYTATVADDIGGATYDAETDGGVIKSGDGMLVLSGTNTYVGGTTISGGKLSVSADEQLGDTSGGVTFDGGVIRYGAAFALDSGRTLTVSDGGGGIDTAGQDVVLSNALTHDASGAATDGGFTKSGNGTLTLSGANTYNGGTTLSGGTLSVDSDSRLGDPSGGLTFDGGTLNCTGDFVSARAITVNNGGGNGTIESNGNAIRLSGSILNGTSPGTLTINGTLDLTATTSGDPLTIDAAVAADALSADADATVNGSGSLTVDGSAAVDVSTGTFGGTTTLVLANTNDSTISGGSFHNVTFDSGSAQTRSPAARSAATSRSTGIRRSPAARSTERPVSPPRGRSPLPRPVETLRFPAQSPATARSPRRPPGR